MQLYSGIYLSNDKDNGEQYIYAKYNYIWTDISTQLLRHSIPMAVDVSIILIDLCKKQKCFTRMVDFSV